MNGMPTPLRPSADTIQAYEQTDYLAEDQPPVCLRIGDSGQQHRAWLARHGATSASILTAWNPFGQELARAENDALQSRLQTTILHSNLAWLPARGEDPKGSWQPEPGFCVFDMPPPCWMNGFSCSVRTRRYGWMPTRGADWSGTPRLPGC